MREYWDFRENFRKNALKFAKYAQNMRKYAQICAKLEKSEICAKYAEICGNMRSAYFPPLLIGLLDIKMSLGESGGVLRVPQLKRKADSCREEK